MWAASKSSAPAPYSFDSVRNKSMRTPARRPPGVGRKKARRDLGESVGGPVPVGGTAPSYDAASATYIGLSPELAARLPHACQVGARVIPRINRPPSPK